MQQILYNFMTGKNRSYLKYIKVFWAVFILVFLFFVVLFILISKGHLGFMPNFEDLENPNNNIASEVYSQDNVLLGTYYIQNRTYVAFDDLSPNIVNALIATEDIRFTRHSGIDVRGLARVLLKTLVMGREESGGGSTITQQLAKNLFPRDTTTYGSELSRGLNLILAKFKEWVTAVKLERNYTKEEILVMYLNTVPFGSESYGIKAAAKTFFNKAPDELNIEESALMVGVLKAPSWYSPVRNPERAKHRRNIVLSQMEKYGYISSQQYDSLSKLDIELDYKVQNHNVGLATYFRSFLRNYLNADKPERNHYYSFHDFREDSVKWINDPLYGWCKKNIKPDGTPYNLYRDGLKIYTTVNSKMQQYAEESVREHLSEELQPQFFEEKSQSEFAPYSEELEEKQIEQILKTSIRRTDRYWRLRSQGISEDTIMDIFKKPVKMTVFSWEGNKDTVMSPLDSIKYYKHFLRAGLMSVNPENGHTKAYVGGIDFKNFKYNHVTQSKRQVGSTIKPFLYTLAMQEGFHPCDQIPNVPTTFHYKHEGKDTTWTPKNSGPSEYEGKYVTLKFGLAKSINYITAKLMKEFNPPSVIKLMKKMGITSYLAPVPALALGTSGISLYEMVSAYSTYANEGVHVEPIFVTRIEDKNNNVIATFNTNQEEVISKETAYLMIELLQEVVRMGTAIRLRLDYYPYQLMNEIGGKTGTTQDHADGWFMGIVPQLVSGVWVGGEDRAIHFDNITQGQGANMALPIWAIYMKKLYNDSTLNVEQYAKFKKPKNFSIELDCDEYEQNKSKDKMLDYNQYLDDYY